METSMWKFYPNKDALTYRLQTEEPKVIRKLKRRQGAELVGWSTNSKLHIFHLSYSDRFKAIIGLERLTGRKCYYNALEGVIMPEITPILTS